MVTTHSSNSLIRKAVASINKAVKAHAYRAVLSGFNVKSKAQFIANSYSECNILYVRPQAHKGYGALLKAAEKLGEFSWAQLLLSIPHYAQRIKEAYTEWGKYSGFKKTVYSKDGKSKQQRVSFNSYANNYFNSYRAYFVKNCIIARVKGKRGIYTLTPNGKLLLSGMKQLNTMR